ncbi:hypothetical protein BC936DRAFT_143309 [Jimgerdemannia flammicorona]|uniref:Uncharacterized protein n=1 Tax=Jimgerdemannia flammicorona TaxID=994334 RepID=A0A433DE36_9FUNG|nr:hypothetical protein BC936DRAFT_143309 [Jimgerdemannia flammicorona]
MTVTHSWLMVSTRVINRPIYRGLGTKNPLRFASLQCPFTVSSPPLTLQITTTMKSLSKITLVALLAVFVLATLVNGAPASFSSSTAQARTPPTKARASIVATPHKNAIMETPTNIATTSSSTTTSASPKMKAASPTTSKSANNASGTPTSVTQTQSTGTQASTQSDFFSSDPNGVIDYTILPITTILAGQDVPYNSSAPHSVAGAAWSVAVAGFATLAMFGFGSELEEMLNALRNLSILAYYVDVHK